MSTIPEDQMPAPRIELRWRDTEPVAGDFYTWTVECDYALVLPLRESDIRRERCDADGNALPSVDTQTIVIGTTRSTNAAASRYNPGLDNIDTPFRDHAHAMWDAPHLGNPPIYAVAGGRAMLLIDDQENVRAKS